MNETNFPIIDEADIPERSKKGGKWDNILNSIEPGKVLVIRDDQAKPGTLRVMLRTKQKKGQYPTLRLIHRSQYKRSYIVNPKQENSA